MILLLYYIFVWPFVSIGGAIVDAALVRLGYKRRPATGPAVPRARTVRR